MRVRFRRHVGLSICLAGATVIPAWAQQDEGGRKIVFDVEQRLEHTTNPGLDVPKDDATSYASTRLNFGFSDTTRVSSFRFDAGGDLRIEDSAGVQDPVRFVSSSARLSYRRQVPTSAFGVDAYSRNAEIEFLRPLEDFLNPETGDIELPIDSDALDGEGTRNAYGASVFLETGMQAPLGFRFDASVDAIDYSDVTDPDLYRIDRSNVGVAAILRLSAVDTARVGLSYDTYKAEDVEETRRETRLLEIGYGRELSSTAQLGVDLNYSVVDTEEFGIDSSVQGLGGRLGLSLERPNGTAEASIASEQLEDGDRIIFNVGRAVELPLGEFAANLGATRPAGNNDWVTTGDLRWTYNLPLDRIEARLERTVRSDRDNAEAVASQLSLKYARQLTAVSDFSLGVTYAQLDREVGVDTIRSDLSATYSHALTADWRLNAGISYRTYDRDGSSQADSSTVFVGLGRTFEWRP